MEASFIFGQFVGGLTASMFLFVTAVGLSLIAVILGALIPATLLFAWGRGQMRRLLQSTETSS